MVKHIALKINLLKFYFYENEGMRPHIHVDFKNQKLCEIWLDTMEIKKQYDISSHELNGIIKIVNMNKEILTDFWNEIFGGQS